MMNMKACWPHKVAFLLLVVGGVNWGLVGFFDWNLVEALLGQWPMVERVVYGVVGISAVVSLFSGYCTMCKAGKN